MYCSENEKCLVCGMNLLNEKNEILMKRHDELGIKNPPAYLRCVVCVCPKCSDCGKSLNEEGLCCTIGCQKSWMTEHDTDSDDKRQDDEKRE